MAKNIKVIMELDTRDFDRGVAKVDGKLDKLDSSASKTSASFVKVGAAIAGVASAAAGLASSIQAASSVEQLGITLETIYGDANQAALGLEQVTEAAGKLPLSLAEIQRGVPSLALVEDQFGSLQESIEFTAGIANAFGMSFDEAASQVQRSLTSGISSADMFRERGVSAFLGFEAGAKYTAEETREVFLKSFDAVTAANEKAAQSMAGQYSMIQDAVFQVQEAFGTAFGETLKELMAGVNASFSQNKEAILATARAIGEDLGDALIFLKENFDIIITTLSGLAAGFAALKIASLIQGVIAFAKAFKGLNLVMAANPIGAVATAVGLLIAGLVHLTQETGSVHNAFVWMGNGIIDVFNGVVNWIESLVIKATGAASVIKEAVAGIFNGEGFIDSARSAWDRVLAEAQGAFDDNPVDFRFEYDSSILKEVTVTAQKVSTGIKEVANANQAVTESLVEIDTKSEEITNKALERGQALIDQIEKKTEASERELDIMHATLGLTDDEAKLKEKLMRIEHDLLDTTRRIHELNLGKEETNRLIKEAQAETQGLIDVEKEKHDKAMEYKATEMAADEERNKKRQALEKQTTSLVEDLNTKTYASMENAFVDFVSTGKMNFKDLVDEMLDQLKRLVAKKIFQTILGIFGGGGGLGSIFAGFFDQGGIIPAGKFGIVGEKGPEIVSGPAKVVGRTDTERMLADAGSGAGGGTNVTYNISAVDAQSFKELVASDPEFLYNVTQAGARLQPI